MGWRGGSREDIQQPTTKQFSVVYFFPLLGLLGDKMSFIGLALLSHNLQFQTVIQTNLQNMQVELNLEPTVYQWMLKCLNYIQNKGKCILEMELIFIVVILRMIISKVKKQGLFSQSKGTVIMLTIKCSLFLIQHLNLLVQSV